MVFILGAFGMNFPIFASTMAIEFGEQADGYGLLSSILAIGSLAGALLAARRDRARIRVVIGGTLLFAVAATVSAFMPTYWLYAVTLMVTGFAVVTTLTTANGYVQTTTDPALRGRVMALYMAILMGGTPIGAPIVGWVAGEFGPRAAILLGAAAASSRSRSERPGCWHPAASAATSRGGSASRSTRRGPSASCVARGVQRRGRRDDADPAVPRRRRDAARTRAAS